MKKIKFLLLTFFAVLTQNANAQIGGIDQTANDISATISNIFPILLGAIFLIGFLFNAGFFFGENADVKKGITRILLFVLISGAVVGIFTYLTTIAV